MSSSSGTNGGDVARSAGAAAVKGALLIGLAVILGIFLLERGNDNATSSAATTTPTKPKTTTTTTMAHATSTSTTIASTPPKQPSDLALIVLNGGAASGKAGAMSTSLRQLGYTNQNDANNWAGHSQSGNSVLCKPGFSREAVALSQQPPLQGSTVGDWPTPPPPFSDTRDCVVVVGS